MTCQPSRLFKAAGANILCALIVLCCTSAFAAKTDGTRYFGSLVESGNRHSTAVVTNDGPVKLANSNVTRMTLELPEFSGHWTQHSATLASKS